MITTRDYVFYVATTRFNSTTWKENEAYRDKFNFEGCLYGTPSQIATTIPPNSMIFILEMLNIPRGSKEAPGKIMGIGIIRNRPNYRKYRSIYSDHNYNRHVYIGKWHVDRDSMTPTEQSYLPILETMVFCGYDHLKRGQGITCLPKKKLKGKKHELLEYLRPLFLKQFIV